MNLNRWEKDYGMQYPDAEQPFHQQTTVAMPSLNTQQPSPENANPPAWPPPPRPRPPQGPSTRSKVLVVILASVLILGGLGLLIYSTTSQYSHALGALNGSNASATARSRISSQATLAHQQTATAGPLQTADAQIYATATAQAAPSATASAVGVQGTATGQAMAALWTKDTGGTPALNDPLSDNSQGNTWDEGYTDNNNTGCNFVNGSYQVQEALAGFLRPCFADATSFSNFAYQVSMTFNSNCAGGLLLRGNKDAGKYYLFMVATNGSYLFESYDGNTYTSLAVGTVPTTLTTDQTITLATIANHGTFNLFVNQTYLASVQDSQLSSGQIGVVVQNTSLPASASFSNAEVWKI